MATPYTIDEQINSLDDRSPYDRGVSAIAADTRQSFPLEPTPDFGDPLSYERDIQPMKKVFFRSAYNTGGRNAGALYAMNAARADQSFNAEMQSRAREYGLYQQKMGLDIANLQLQKAREEAERERNDAATIAPLVQELDTLSSDPTLTQEQAVMRHGQIGLKYGNVLANSKGAVASFNAVGNSIKALKPEPKKGMDIGNVVANVGASPKAMAVVTEWKSKNPDKDELPIDIVGTAMQEKAKEVREAESATTKSTLMTKLQVENLNTLFENVGKAKLAKDITEKEDPNKFATMQDEAAVSTVIDAYGPYVSPDMQEKLKSGNAQARLKAAAEIRELVNTGKIPFTPYAPPKQKSKGAVWAE